MLNKNDFNAVNAGVMQEYSYQSAYVELLTANIKKIGLCKGRKFTGIKKPALKPVLFDRKK